MAPFLVHMFLGRGSKGIVWNPLPALSFPAASRAPAWELAGARSGPGWRGTGLGGEAPSMLLHNTPARDILTPRGIPESPGGRAPPGEVWSPGCQAAGLHLTPPWLQGLAALKVLFRGDAGFLAQAPGACSGPAGPVPWHPGAQMGAGRGCLEPGSAAGLRAEGSAPGSPGPQAGWPLPFLALQLWEDHVH